MRKFSLPTALTVFGSVAILVGLVSYLQGTKLVPAECWGHLGCDYRTHTYNVFGYIGILLVLVGVVCFFEGIFWNKKALVTKIIVGTFGLILALMIYGYLIE